MVVIFWAFAISISKNFTHGFTYNIKFILILISFEFEKLRFVRTIESLNSNINRIYLTIIFEKLVESIVSFLIVFIQRMNIERKKWTDVADDNALLTVRRHVARGREFKDPVEKPAVYAGKQAWVSHSSKWRQGVTLACSPAHETIAETIVLLCAGNI